MLKIPSVERRRKIYFLPRMLLLKFNVLAEEHTELTKQQQFFGPHRGTNHNFNKEEQ